MADEQRRVYLAIVLSVIVLIGWELMMGPQVVPIDAVPEAPTTDVVKDALDSPGDTVISPEAADGAAALASADEQSVVDTSQAVVEERTIPRNDGLLRQTWTNEGPVIKRLELVNYTERNEDDEMESVKLTDSKQRQAKLSIASDQIPFTGRWNVEDSGTTQVFTSTQANGLAWRLELQKATTDYTTDVMLTVSNTSDRPIVSEANLELFINYPEEGSFLAPPLMYRGLCYDAEDELQDAEQGDVEDGPIDLVTSGAKWAAVDYQYFLVAAIARENVAGGCKAKAGDDIIELSYQLLFETLPAGQSKSIRYSLFAGPKSSDELKAVSSDLTFAIDYSIMGIPLGALARPMILALNVFHDMSQSWGIAIILLTFVVKLILFPVTYKSVVSMRKMQLLKPELDKIKTRFPNDKEKQQMAQLKLMQEQGVNPLGGCLPMVLQMPVWFALYRALWSAVDLYQQSFLWIADLTQPEPFPVLAILVGGVTALQQKVTPTTGDPQQAKMMMIFMPIMLTVFMVALPSGLVFYVLVNSVLSIVQQVVINRRVPKLQPA